MSQVAVRQLALEPLIDLDRELAPSATRRHKPGDTAPNAASASPARQQRFDAKFVAACATVLSAACGIGVFLWWQPQATDSRAIVSAVPAAPSAHPDTPTPAKSSPATAVPREPTLAAPNPPSPAAAPIVPAPRIEPLLRRTAAARLAPPLLGQAYQAFNNGAYDHAQATWVAYLRIDPRNADALHGLAAIALSRGEPGHAADYLRRALAADPKDALAFSGLLMLADQSAPEQDASRLKTLLAEQPDSPHLHFALGNLHAAAARWAEAQQDYFAAHVAAPTNPDYLFNLAVSLDHLHQPRQAALYYGLALDAAAALPTHFDKTQATARLTVLSP